MPTQTEEYRHSDQSLKQEYYADEIDIGEIIRSLYLMRRRLLKSFFLFFSVGLLGFGFWQYSRPKTAVAHLVLGFKGIEKGEYPGRNKFSTDDIRAPYILDAALADVRIPRDSMNNLRGSIGIVPVIPSNITAQWKKTNNDGGRREEYFPNEFDISMGLNTLPDAKGLQLLDAILRRYRERVKLEQVATFQFVSDWSKTSPEQFLEKYDYWDIPEILNQDVELMSSYLNQLSVDAPDYENPTLQFLFQDIRKDLNIWSATHLNLLRAMASTGRFLKNKDLVLMKIRYRLETLSIEIRQRQGEIAENMKLIETLQKPQRTLALTTADKTELDSSAVDRLLKNDYIAPLVKRIMTLQQETKTLEAEQSHLAKAVVVIAKAQNVSPATILKEIQGPIITSLKELQAIINDYNKLLDQYLTVMSNGFVFVQNGPRIEQEGPSARNVLILIVIFSGLFAFSWVYFTDMVRAFGRPVQHS